MSRQGSYEDRIEDFQRLQEKTSEKIGKICQKEQELIPQKNQIEADLAKLNRQKEDLYQEKDTYARLEEKARKEKKQQERVKTKNT